MSQSYEHYMEDWLNIKTSGYREFGDPNNLDVNRTESTEYEVLNRMRTDLPWPERMNFVDVGCGKGRALFYFHHYFQVPVTGIEVNQETFQDLRENKKAYLSKWGTGGSEINLFRGFVADYPIQAENNVFYFFNPFSAKYFVDLLLKVLESKAKYPRDIYFILYYPHPHYLKILEEAQSQVIYRIDLQSKLDYREEILFYKI